VPARARNETPVPKRYITTSAYTIALDGLSCNVTGYNLAMIKSFLHKGIQDFSRPVAKRGSGPITPNACDGNCSA
jgi:hypothetical protein